MKEFLQRFWRRVDAAPPEPPRAEYWAVYETTLADFQDDRPPGRLVVALPTMEEAFLFVQEANRELVCEGSERRYVTRREPAALVHLMIEEIERERRA